MSASKLIKEDPTITDAAVAAISAMLVALDGLDNEEARVAVLNVAVRTLACHSDSPEDGKARAYAMGKDIAEGIRKNWPRIEAERAENGGRQPTWFE